MPRVYVAGPMRGLPNSNFESFDRAKRILERQGWGVISPADMDRDTSENPTGSEGEKVGVNGGDPAWCRVFIRRDMDILVNLLKAEDGDAIAILPGCDDSTGCTAELAIARWAKLKAISAISGLDITGVKDPKAFVNRELREHGWADVADIFCPSCGEGRCPTMAEIVEQQANGLANSLPGGV